MSLDDQSGRKPSIKTLVAIALPVAIVLGVLVGLVVSGAFTSDNEAVTSTTTTLPGDATTLDPEATSVAFEAVEDTYIDSEEPALGHGTTSALLIENDPPEITQTLIRFEVTGIPEGEDISQAVLRLIVNRESEATIDVSLVSGSWDSSTSWSDAPEPGELVGTIQPGGLEGSVVEADVTGAVTGNGTVDLILTTQSDDSSEFQSADSGSPPVLVVAWGGASVPASVPEAGSASTTTEPETGSGENPDDTTSTTVFSGPTTEDLELTGSHAVLVGAADIADCDHDDDDMTASLVEAVLADEPSATVFTAGDNVSEDGTPEEFAECFDPTWGRFKELIRPSVGNHDLAGGGYYPYFGEAAGTEGEGYYSYEAGSWLVIVLNTMCDQAGGCELESPQGQWLSQLLASSNHSCVLAMYHHPMFSSGEHGGEDWAQDLYTLLYDAGAEVVLNGHDHNYERFAPQDPEGNLDVANGIRQFVVGTGGSGRDPIPDLAPNSEVRFAATLGVFQLKLFETGYEWEFIPEPGSNNTDSGANSCH